MPRVPVHSASPQRRQQLVEPCADYTSEVASIEMSFTPRLIVAQIYTIWAKSIWDVCNESHKGKQTEPYRY